MQTTSDTDIPCDVARRGAVPVDETAWRDYVRPGWLVTDQPEPDGWFYAVRNSDGKVVEGGSRSQIGRAHV